MMRFRSKSGSFGVFVDGQKVVFNVVVNWDISGFDTNSQYLVPVFMGFL